MNSHTTQMPITQYEGRAYMRGTTAGLFGALSLMGTMGIADFFRGELFYTPSLFGSMLFAGEVPVAVNPTMALAYTFVHLGLFTAFGILAARVMRLELSRRTGDFKALAGISAALFVAMTLFVAGLGLGFSPSLFAVMGVGTLLFGNAVAALIMGAVLVATR